MPLSEEYLVSPDGNYGPDTAFYLSKVEAINHAKRLGDEAEVLYRYEDEETRTVGSEIIYPKSSSSS
jgi:CRISPR/Cas system CMR-associated protein Cmr5 small subunit